MNEISRSEIEYLIEEWCLNERNRSILKRKLIDGITFEKLAEEFDMSVGQIKSIVYKYRNIFQTKITQKMDKN